MSNSKTSLYAPFRSLGHICDHVPFAIHSHATSAASVLGAAEAGGKAGSTVILTSVGRGWALWTADGLRLILVGPMTPESITALAFHSSGAVLAAAGNTVYIYNRGQLVGQLDCTASGPPATNGAHGKARRRSNGLTAMEVGSVAGSDGENDGEIDKESSESESESSSSGASSRAMEGPSWANDAPMDGESVVQLVTFGNQVVGLSSRGTRAWVWDFELRELHALLEFPPDFVATCVLHPSTYLNKILVGSRSGSLAIYNTRTTSLIHTFSPSSIYSLPSRRQEAFAAVTCLEQGPAVDVVAIGFDDGHVRVVDIRVGEELLNVKMDLQAEEPNNQAITGLAFRSDPQSQLLATSSAGGHVALWNLSSSNSSSPGPTLLHLLRSVHSSIASLAFLPSSPPVLVTSSRDNSLKQHLIPTPGALPRVLNSREGHSGPVGLVRYYGSDGKSLLTAGSTDRSFRLLSVVRDSRSAELSQGSLAKKATAIGTSVQNLRLPAARRVAWSTAREKDWDNVVTVHTGAVTARTWSALHKRLGKHTLEPPGNKGKEKATKGEAKCCEVTACGNYGLVGDDRGSVRMWNLQSGMFRREFSLPSVGEKEDRKRTRCTVGVAVDALNRTVVVGTLFGHLHFFDFATASLTDTLALPGGATAVLLQRSNNLLAVSCEDLKVRVVDIETRRVVREFGGAKGRILDMTFSPDARWLVTASLDSVIRTYDLPTGSLLDAFRPTSVASTLSFSPSGDFLATGHVDSVGVSLWVNRAQFAEVSLLGSARLKAETEEEVEPEKVELPTLEGREDAAAESTEELLRPGAWTGQEAGGGGQRETGPLAEGLVTFSLVSRAKWQTLLNLDTIKARNKPKEPPKAPERAPFFIPTVAGLAGKPVWEMPPGDDSSASRKRKAELGPGAAVEGEFERLLRAGEADSWHGFFSHLASLPPSALDGDVRSLSPATAPDLLPLLLRALALRLRSGPADLALAVLALTTRAHGEALAGAAAAGGDDAPEEGGSGAEARAAMEECERAVRDVRARVGALADYAVGVRAFIAGSAGVVA